MVGCDEVGVRVRRQDHWRAWPLMEVEISYQVPEDLHVLPHVWPRVGSAVGARIDPPAAQEVVLDERVVGVEGQHLVVDESSPGIGADHQARYPEPVTIAIDGRRVYVVVEAAPVIPGQEDGC